jgi:Na+/proline symporter
MAFLPRFFMIKDLKSFKWAPVLTPIFTIAMGILTWSVPFVYLGLQAQGLAPALAQADEVMPTFLMLFAPNILAGLLMAGALSATMSTAAVYMNIGAATLVNDLGMKHLKIKLKNPVAAARWATVLFAIVAAILALTTQEFVMMMGIAAVGIWGSTVGAVLTFGLLWKGATKEGAIAGASIGLIFSIGLALMSMYGIYKLPYSIIPGGVGALLSFLTVFIVSLYTKKTPMDEQMERVVALPLIARGI